jgi:uncharacterized protein YprB with RNaseH-like and TPR domain
MNKKRKVLICDIETSLMKVNTFYIGNKVRIGPDQIIEPSKIICISYKWRGEKKVHNIVFDIEKQCHKQLLKDFLEVAKTADEVVAYNGDNFDVKWIAGAAALEGIEAWDWNLTTDPFKQYKRSFRFPSFKLDYIAATLGFGHKNPMGFQDWVDIQNGCKKALKKMVKYCDKDVVLLEKVFDRLDKYTKKTVSETYRNKAGHAPRPGIPGNWIRFGVYRGKQRWYCKDTGKTTSTGG